MSSLPYYIPVSSSILYLVPQIFIRSYNFHKEVTAINKHWNITKNIIEMSVAEKLGGLTRKITKSQLGAVK